MLEHMADVQFEVRHGFHAPARVVWDELVDWKGHEKWVPMTRVDVGEGAPTSVGAQFTAWTGPGRLALEDRMEVVRCDWNDDTESGDCEVTKVGPVLHGRAGFTIEPKGAGSELVWFEDVKVPYVPQFLAPLVGRVGAFGFRTAIRKLAKLVSE